MKKIILIVVGIILVAIVGKDMWTYQQMKNEMTTIVNEPEMADISTSTAKSPTQSVQVATTSPVIVATTGAASIPTGGKPCSLQKQTNQILISGRVIFPKGISEDNKFAVEGVEGKNTLKLFPVDKEGTFCAVVDKGGANIQPSFVIFRGSNKNSFDLLKIINSPTDLHGLIVDAKSTAVASVFISAFDGILEYADTRILNIIEVNADVLKLATDIDVLSNITSNDFRNDGRLSSDITNAENSVIKALTTTTAVISGGHYSLSVIEGAIDSVTPLPVEGTQAVVNVSPGTNAYFVVDKSTKFTGTTKPAGDQIIEFKSATVVVYYDKSKKSRVVENVSKVEL